jgi:hypothetical protein
MPRIGFGTATATLGQAEGHAGVKGAGVAVPCVQGWEVSNQRKNAYKNDPSIGAKELE